MNSAVRNNYATWKKWLMLGNKHHCCKTLGRYSQLKTHGRREKTYFLGQGKVPVFRSLWIQTHMFINCMWHFKCKQLSTY